MSLYKKPSWMTQGFSFRASLRMGAAPYNPGAFEPRYVPKPTGEYNPGGGYENREVTKPAGTYNAGRFEARSTHRPTGAYNPGAFEERESPDPDPWGGYYFSLQIKGSGGEQEVAHFMECSGLKSVATVFEIEEGGLNGRTHKRAGQSRWENIVLRYATSSNTFMLEWRDKFLQDQFGERTKFSGAIVLRNNKGDAIRTYAFKNAWPVSWEGPSFNGGSSDLAIETLELAHDGLEVETHEA